MSFATDTWLGAKNNRKRNTADAAYAIRISGLPVKAEGRAPIVLRSVMALVVLGGQDSFSTFAPASSNVRSVGWGISLSEQLTCDASFLRGWRDQRGRPQS